MDPAAVSCRADFGAGPWHRGTERNGAEPGARLREGAAGRAEAHSHLDAIVPRLRPRNLCPIVATS
eukprot:8277545-Pyramimonas_sp.AAC.1